MAAPPDSQPDRMEVYYHKSNFFRVVHSDGCYGGSTGRGTIHCGLYSERAAIPLRTALPVVDGQVIGPEEVVESKPGLVRELEVDVIMDLNTALSFYVWLRDKLEHLRRHSNIPDEQWKDALGERS